MEQTTKKKREIENWDHYFTLASGRPDLREFKDLLQVNFNQPGVDLSKFEVSTKDGYRTFEQLIKELAPDEKP